MSDSLLLQIIGDQFRVGIVAGVDDHRFCAGLNQNRIRLTDVDKMNGQRRIHLRVNGRRRRVVS